MTLVIDNNLEVKELPVLTDHRSPRNAGSYRVIRKYKDLVY